MMERQAEADLIERLYTSLHFPTYVEELNARLKEEARKRREFYEMITEDDKVEFINGEIVYQSPVKLRHIVSLKRLLILLDTYVNRHELGLVGYEKMMISLSRNDYEPDLCFFRQEKAEAFVPDQMHFPAPDLIVEVLSPSTEERDRGIKFEDYAAHDVGEYWLVDPDGETIEQYRLVGGAYELVMKSKSGEIESAAVPGFTIPVRSVFDEEAHRAALQVILET
jgi:Uma2 family endonuclease